MRLRHTIGTRSTANRRQTHFQQELQDAGRAIQCAPERWANYLFGTRRYMMKRYPFVLVYRVATERIEIVAVAHAKRNPGYWKERLDFK